MPTDKGSWLSDGQLIRRGDTEGAGLGGLDLVREAKRLEDLSHFVGFCLCLSILDTIVLYCVVFAAGAEP